jgi:hypothetical protein
MVSLKLQCDYGLTGVSVLYQYLLAFAVRDHKNPCDRLTATNPGP